jgi:hypothetical protein
MDKQKPTAELLNIIRGLFYESTGHGRISIGAFGDSSSANKEGERVDERNNIIARVDSQFNECDERIDKYIRNSSKDLTRLIKVFNDIAKKIEVSRGSVKQSRESLKQCKVLLQSKRDDVRRLWLEWCEQKFYYENLTKLRQLYSASEQIRAFASEKKFLKAAELLSDSIQILNTQFRDISGLVEVKRQLEVERIKLEKNLLQELTDQLYANVTKSVLESGSGTQQSSSSSRRFYRNYQQDNVNNNSPNKTAELLIQSIVQSAAKLNQNASLNLNNNEPNANLNIVDKMINEINREMSNQLVSMINSTSNHVVESNLIGNSSNGMSTYRRYYNSSIENNPKYLSQLIELTFEQFKIMARLYKSLIEQASKLSSSTNSNKYHYGFVWTCIQSILVQLLEEYLRQTNQNSMANNQEMLDNMDINSFFARKRLINLAFGGGNDTNQSTNSNNQALNQNSNNNQFAAQGSSFFGNEDNSQRRLFTFKGNYYWKTKF